MAEGQMVVFSLVALLLLLLSPQTETAQPDCRVQGCTNDNPCVTVQCNEDTGKCVTSKNPCPPPQPCQREGNCDHKTGLCSYHNIPNGKSCDDGNLCTSGDTCQSGQCVGTGTTCTPLDSCHIAGTCDPATGVCSNPEIPCTALDNCHTPGTCDPATGVCSNPPVVCNPSDSCHTAGTCDLASGLCSNPPGNDGGSCTTPTGLSGTCNSGQCMPNPAPPCVSGGTYSASYTDSCRRNFPVCQLQICGGQTATISLCGCNGDTYVRLFDSGGSQVAVNDDSCGFCSYLQYAPPADLSCQTYFLGEGCFWEDSCSAAPQITIQ